MKISHRSCRGMITCITCLMEIWVAIDQNFDLLYSFNKQIDTTYTQTSSENVE